MPIIPALAALALSATTASLSVPDPAPALSAPAPRLKLLGVQLDAGVPGGGVASVVVRPIKWVRADAGFAYNYFSNGARGGITVVPFHWAVVPTLRLEAGRFFESDVSDKVESFGDELPTFVKPAFKKFGYDYASAQLGLEFGSQRHFVFFVRGGLTWLKADFGDGADVFDEDEPDTRFDVTGLSAKASGPTASLGFLFYVW